MGVLGKAKAAACSRYRKSFLRLSSCEFRSFMPTDRTMVCGCLVMYVCLSFEIKFSMCVRCLTCAPGYDSNCVL